MRRWNLAVFAAAVLGSIGCQTAASTTETAQAATNVCTLQMPPTTYWDGSNPPVPTATQVYIMMTPTNGQALTALVDYQAMSVPWARYVHAGKRGSFVDRLPYVGRIIIGGVPPPPPPVIPWSKLAGVLVVTAMQFADVPAQAVAEFEGMCGPL